MILSRLLPFENMDIAIFVSTSKLIKARGLKLGQLIGEDN